MITSTFAFSHSLVGGNRNRSLLPQIQATLRTFVSNRQGRRGFRFTHALVAFAVLLVFSPVIVPAAVTAPLPAGTKVTIRTLDPIHSRQAAVGQSYRCTVAEPVLVNGKVIVNRGADCVLQVVETKESGKLTGKSELKLELTQIRIAKELVDVNSDISTQESKGKGKGTGMKAGLGAAAGAALGGLFGGGKGAAIGAAIGAGAGLTTAALTHGPEIRVAPETLLTFVIH